MVPGKTRRARRGEEDVAPVFHDRDRQVDRMADVAECRGPAGTAVGADHDARVELDLTVAVQRRAEAGVEERLVLHVAHGRHHRRKRTASDQRPA